MPKRARCKFNGRQPLLEMGVVSRKIRNLFDVKADVYYLELNFDALVKTDPKPYGHGQRTAKIPGSETRPGTARGQERQLRATAQDCFRDREKLLKSVSLFDVYEGDKLPEGKKIVRAEFRPRRP